jgi:hypothetical protein
LPGCRRAKKSRCCGVTPRSCTNSGSCIETC